ncbi:DNA modification system-associated small protein [Terribacillus saccharophilus]|uniref:DNA modification system-associated small protein n=1 Tax=Terribacillus saccharophilus TaxID=361277 RepID=UPI000C9B784A|nr:hypothetical protein [Terribacillus goriensis]
MHPSEKLLMKELIDKHEVSAELIDKLLKEAKRNSYQNETKAKRVAEIDGLMSFHMYKIED